jgi:hypothetical protein
LPSVDGMLPERLTLAKLSALRQRSLIVITAYTHLTNMRRAHVRAVRYPSVDGMLPDSGVSNTSNTLPHATGSMPQSRYYSTMNAVPVNNTTGITP